MDYPVHCYCWSKCQEPPLYTIHSIQRSDNLCLFCSKAHVALFGTDWNSGQQKWKAQTELVSQPSRKMGSQERLGARCLLTAIKTGTVKSEFCLWMIYSKTGGTGTSKSSCSSAQTTVTTAKTWKWELKHIFLCVRKLYVALRTQGAGLLGNIYWISNCNVAR